MINIILIILKIMGIIILAILGLLLLIILVGLFVPVIYRICGTKQQGDMQAKGRATWLFMTVIVNIDNQDKQLKVRIRFFGIPLESFQKLGRGLQFMFKPVGILIQGIKSRASKKATTREINTKEIAKVEQPNTTKTNPIKQEIKNNINKNLPKEEIPKVANKKISRWQRIKNFFIRIWHFLKWLGSHIRKIWLTIKGICGKIKKWKEFVTSDTFKGALRFVLNRGNILYKHILPRKVKGNVVFGFDDPAMTGQTLALVSILTPIYKSKLKVVPVFDEPLLEGNIDMRGYVVGFVLLRVAWSVYRNQDVKAVIHHFSQKEA